MAANTNLHKAKEAKNDEFYTQLTDVGKELKSTISYMSVLICKREINI